MFRTLALVIMTVLTVGAVRNSYKLRLRLHDMEEESRDTGEAVPEAAV